MEQRYSRKRIWAGSMTAALVCLALLLLTGCSGGTDSTPPPPALPAAPPVEDTTPAEPEPEPEPPAESPAESQPVPEPDPIGDAGVLDYEIETAKSVEAVCAGKNGILGIVKVKITNPTAYPARLHYTLSALGAVTPERAVNGLAVDQLFAFEPEARLAVYVTFKEAEPKIKSVVAAVDAATPEIGAGESATGYWYFFLTEDELGYKQLGWMEEAGDGWQRLGIFQLTAIS